MIRKLDPRQKALFDPFHDRFSPVAYKTVTQGWQGVFRHVILELMAVDVLEGEFDPELGRPTKQLYSMAGLVFLMEFSDWTHEEAVRNYMFGQDVQYALNLPTEQVSLCTRTLERYLDIFRKNDLAARVSSEVTQALADALEQDVRRQRLDSSHVFSNMAAFGRTRLMGVTIKRFLTQVKRHAPAAYETLPEALRGRYAACEHRLFAEAAKDSDSRRRLRQQVAEDLYELVERFADDAAFQGRSTYLALRRVFEEQCEVVQDKVEVKAKTGGAVMQNPSDPDATYDGHKGPGYQAQFSETCSPANEVQLILCVLPETAALSDGEAAAPVLEQLDASGLLPDELAADTAYGSDENVQTCAGQGVALVAPVPGKSPDAEQFTLADFVIDETTEEVLQCPAGHAPIACAPDPDTGTTRTQMAPSACAACPDRERCPVRQNQKSSRLDHSAKQRRIDQRRRGQDTEAFRERYTIRSGIESTNSGVKRRTGLGRLRVRGKQAVFQAIFLKAAGWNVLRASASKKMRALVARRIQEALAGIFETAEKSGKKGFLVQNQGLIETFRTALNSICRPRISTRNHVNTAFVCATA